MSSDILFDDDTVDLRGKFVMLGAKDNPSHVVIRGSGKTHLVDCNTLQRWMWIRGQLRIDANAGDGPETSPMVVRDSEGGPLFRLTQDGAVVVGGAESQGKNSAVGNDGSVLLRQANDKKSIELITNDRDGTNAVVIFQSPADHTKSKEAIVLRSDGTIHVRGPGSNGKVFLWNENAQQYVDIGSALAEHRAKIHQLEAQVALLMGTLL